MSLQKLIKPLLLLLFTFSLSVATTLGASAAPLKLATVAPEGSAWMNAMRAGADEINDRTNGRVKVKFYGGGVMGNEASVTRKIRIGQLHGAALTSGGVARIYPDLAIYSLPFLFDSAEEAAFVRKHMDATLMQGLENNGFVGFGMAQGGFGKLMSANKMQTLDDLKGKKLWVPEDDDISYDMMSDLGLSPVKLPLTDVLTGLQTQLLEIVGTSAIGAIALQWHTKVKHVLDQPLVYIYGTLVIDKRFFDKFSAADQAIVKEVFTRVYAKMDADNFLDNENAEKALRENGVSFDQGNKEEVANIIAQVTTFTEELVKEGKVSKDLYNKIQGYKREYQATQ